MAPSCFLAPIARASPKLRSSSKARSTQARKKGGWSMCRVRRPTGRPMDDGGQWPRIAPADGRGVAHVVSMDRPHDEAVARKTESRHGAADFRRMEIGWRIHPMRQGGSRCSCALSRMASQHGRRSSPPSREATFRSGAPTARRGLHVRRRHHSRCGPSTGLRIGGPVPRPHALFRPCPGSAPQAQPMTANFWGNPYDTRDGKQFIVDCTE